MKALMIASMVMRCCAAGLLAAEVKATPPAPDALVIQYDPNGNGKIDVSERKPYVRERARRQREEAKRLAAVFKNVPPNVLRQVEPPGWTKAKLARYDLNQNGKIDERAFELMTARAGRTRLAPSASGRWHRLPLEAWRLKVSGRVRCDRDQ